MRIANASFHLLKPFWTSTVTTKHRIQIFNQICVSQILYGLQHLWLLKRHRDRIDSWVARCLRRIGRIPPPRPPTFRRLSNEAVLKTLDQPRLTSRILQSQLRLFGHIVRCSGSDHLRRVTFTATSRRLDPFELTAKNKCGGQRKRWAQELRMIAMQALPKLPRSIRSRDNLQTIIMDRVRWRMLTALCMYHKVETD